MIVYFMIALA